MAFPVDRYGYPLAPRSLGAPAVDYGMVGGVTAPSAPMRQDVWAAEGAMRPVRSSGPLSGLSFSGRSGGQSTPPQSSVAGDRLGPEAYLAQTGLRSAMVRALYDLQTMRFDRNDKAGRKALKELTRERTPAPMRSFIETVRPSTEARPGSVGRANRTNLKWDMAAGGAGALGAASGKMAVADGLNEVAQAADRPRARAGAIGAAAGGTLGGIRGAEWGAGIGALAVPIAEFTVPVGSVIGGYIGSRYGGAQGRKAGVGLYDRFGGGR